MDYTVVRRDLRSSRLSRSAIDALPRRFPGTGQAFGEMYGQLGVLGVGPAGPPFVIYHESAPS